MFQKKISQLKSGEAVKGSNITTSLHSQQHPSTFTAVTPSSHAKQENKNIKTLGNTLNAEEKTAAEARAKKTEKNFIKFSAY